MRACFRTMRSHCTASDRIIEVIRSDRKPGSVTHSCLAQVSDPVLQAFYARHRGARRAAVECFVRFDSVPDDTAVAMSAMGRKRVDGALERVERVRLTAHGDGERLVVAVPANFALCHRGLVVLVKRLTACFGPERRKRNVPRAPRLGIFEIMCGRSTLHDAPVSVLGKFHLPPMLPGFKARYNIAPSQDQWTIVLSNSGVPVARQLRWGLVPSWADDASVGARLINARSDAVALKPSFKASFRTRRCAILADGYYEWSGAGKARAPFFFHLEGNRDFALAGLWDRWERGGDTLDTCTVITTDASPAAAKVHHRMPVVLTAEQAVEWVDASAAENRLFDLMTPYSGDDLFSYEVSSLVNSPGNDNVDCIAPAPARPLPIELSLFDM